MTPDTQTSHGFDFVADPEDENRQLFASRLTELQAELTSQGFDFRVIGSLATASYIDDNAANLCFNRQNAVTPDQRVPDIDLIAPRDQLDDLREYRRRLMVGSFPIKLGLAVPTATIDYRPEQEESFITHKKLSTAVPSELFAAREQELMEGASVTTVDPNTLFHTYVTCGGRLRPKDVASAMGLRRMIQTDAAASVYSERAYEGFHDFLRQRKQDYRFSMAVERLPGLALDRVSPKARNRIIKFALPIASKLGMR